MPPDSTTLDPNTKRALTICNLFVNHSLRIDDIASLLEENRKAVILTLIHRNIIYDRRHTGRIAPLATNAVVIKDASRFPFTLSPPSKKDSFRFNSVFIFSDDHCFSRSKTGTVRAQLQADPSLRYKTIVSQHADGWRIQIDFREPLKPVSIAGYLVDSLDLAQRLADREILHRGHVCNSSCKEWTGFVG